MFKFDFQKNSKFTAFKDSGNGVYATTFQDEQNAVSVDARAIDQTSLDALKKHSSEIDGIRVADWHSILATKISGLAKRPGTAYDAKLTKDIGDIKFAIQGLEGAHLDSTLKSIYVTPHLADFTSCIPESEKDTLKNELATVGITIN